MLKNPSWTKDIDVFNVFLSLLKKIIVRFSKDNIVK